ncbi:RagB/SusD family nutrient uptake outer membrane protein [Dysgonomonas sp. Marseille-P4677]|uniref:RagB/SusD family nutrient uptake outer membrane protein n=1 Tax=Dysgonomonas sp. Marseille-P4677 TaxID=2364790 RepID=UPI001911C7AF|nr:RagB/SusD family nutrient uptake outer membrane protein [Dysgonomonas sp. Marseille-P4677]MBK5721686.1 RagB/SusD family nutrient uptake outer membrane protein [Dysgonomonas sp. Marseille-P4677]
MKIMKNIIKLLVIIPLFTSCEDMFSPALENNRNMDAMYNEPAYAQGILGYAYAMLPYQSKSETDIATDDAVTNDMKSSYVNMATGSWAANNDPMSQWQSRRAAIQYLNLFIDNADKVAWAKDANVHTMYCDRLKGEAYGLRALNMYYLLMAHGGWTADGKLLGIPNITTAENIDSFFNVPRNTFQECVDQIFDDIAKAIELLPLDYNDIKDADIPAKYKSIGVTNAGDYNRVNGTHIRGRITARIAEAIQSQVALLAASPAYNEGTTVEWADAANYAAIVLNRINGVAGLDPTGGTWYMNKSEIQSLGSGAVPKEILWRGDKDNSTEDYAMGLSQEKSNYPPSLYGSGRINPTQNLVDAFPMANGYPISDASNSGYSSDNPYANRDPRLSNYIIYNGTKYGTSNTEIITGTYSLDDKPNIDGLNNENTSTRTGYYLRKLLRDDCNPNPSYNTAQFHYPVRIRFTEIFLAYAEAANEAWGPTNSGNQNYSAYDVIKAIRARAGVGTSNGDAYLESIKNDQVKMRELIRNERRLELCFENRRFWDLRRWKANINETAQGMQIDKQDNGTLKYTRINVENRSYKDYMYYGPVPYEEILKWSNLQQNQGW